MQSFSFVFWFQDHPLAVYSASSIAVFIRLAVKEMKLFPFSELQYLFIQDGWRNRAELRENLDTVMCNLRLISTSLADAP